MNQKDIDILVGDRDGVEVSYDRDSESYFIAVKDYSLRNHTRFSKAFRSSFTQNPKWDAQTKSYVVPGTDMRAIETALEFARSQAAHLANLRATWLVDIKGQLWSDIDKHERQEFNERLTAALEYRTSHPDEAPTLPPLPKGYEAPVVRDTYADTKEGASHNGPIIAVNDYFVVQYTSRGKLQADEITKSPTHWITLHSTDKFCHTAQDWANPREAVDRALGQHTNSQWKSIEYNGSMKATVAPYNRNLHSPKARQYFAEQAKEKQAQEFAASDAAEAAQVKNTPLKVVQQEIKEEAKAKPTRSRAKKQNQSMAM